MLRVQGFYLMYEGCFFTDQILSKILNVSGDQKTRPSICFKTCSLAFETLSRPFETLGRAFETLGRAFETLDRVFEGFREN